MTAKTSTRFSFTGTGWVNSLMAGTGICLRPANHPKLLAHALALKVGAPSDLKKLKQETLVSKVAAAL